MELELTILGSSSAIPTSFRNTTAQVLNAFGRFFLIDCGEGTQIQLRRFKIPYKRINHIFISHLHGDHFFGLIGFISSLSLQGRKTELNIYSQKKLEQIIITQLEILNIKLSFELTFHYLDSSKHTIIYEDKNISVTSFSLKHRDIPTSGFFFKEKEKPLSLIKEMIEEYNISIVDRLKIKDGADYITSEGELIKNKFLTIKAKQAKSYAFCSDTAYTEKFIDLIKGVDLLYHEATHANDNKTRAKQTYHSTAEQAATIALKSEAKKLIMGHFSTKYKNTKQHIKEARAVFPESYAVEDGDKYQI
jgi:ribonuclease Z